MGGIQLEGCYEKYSETVVKNEQRQWMSVAVTVSVRRQAERMSLAHWRGIVELIDRDETRAGQAGEQKMDDETREHGSVKEDVSI